MTLLAAVGSCFIAAALAPWVTRAARDASGWVLAALPLALTVYFARYAPWVVEAAIREARPWVPGLDVQLSFRLDGLSLLFVLLITGIGTLVVVYAGSYLKSHPQLGRFFATMLAFMGSMLGLVLADDLILLFVFWELTSITSYLLIGFDHEREWARRAALQALLVTGLGGLALLAGALLIGQVVGSFQLSDVLHQGAQVRADPLYAPILLLILLGAFTKSAQVPFHFWLPNAMEAPTPVSAYLHSATMVKAGVYLLMRLRPVLDATELWNWIIVVVGGVTALWGALLALRQTDMKRILAYTTIAALGQLVLLLGMDQPESVKAAFVFLLAHSLYKGGFFLVAGAVDHATGTRDVLRLRGLRFVMPATAVAAIFAGLSMAGLPPVLGFVSKEAGYGAQLGVEGAALVLAAVGVLVNALTFAVAAILVLRPFFGPLRPTPRPPHEVPIGMQLGPAVLATVGLLFGVLPAWVGEALVEPAADAVLVEPYAVILELWPGWEPALALSTATIAVGLAVYDRRIELRRLLARLDPLARVGPAGAYEWALVGLVGLGRLQSRTLERRPLGYGLLASFIAVAAAVGITQLTRDGAAAAPREIGGLLHEWGLAALISAAALAAVLARSRLMAIAALGVSGFGIALVFVSFGAPDLAITQFLFETLIVIIVALILIRLPVYRWPATRGGWSRIRDGAVGIAVGVTMASLLLAVTREPLDPTLSEYYAERSVPDAFGRNIVNVILVDFRALDTLGEVVVIGMAGLGVYALLKLRPARRARRGPGRPDRAAAGSGTKYEGGAP